MRSHQAEIAFLLARSMIRTEPQPHLPQRPGFDHYHLSHVFSNGPLSIRTEHDVWTRCATHGTQTIGKPSIERD